MRMSLGAGAARACRWPRGLAWALWVLAFVGLAVVAWLDHLLREVGRPDLVLLSASGAPSALAIVSAASAGAVLADRRPAHPVGWLLLALALCNVVVGSAEAYASYGLLARPRALPAAGYVGAFANGGVTPFPVLIGFILLLTPTGTLPSPRWRWWARLTAAAAGALVLWALVPFEPPFESVANPLVVPVLGGPLLVAAYGTAIVGLLSVPVGAWSLLVRVRRAHGVERQQLRWVALAAAVAALAVAVLLGGLATGNDAPLVWAGGALVAFLPLAIGASILRYRLYDLDRIISRAVAYALLTVLLGGTYAAMVVGLGQVLGRNSSLVVAIATLAAL
jgi:hypothetical protein